MFFVINVIHPFYINLVTIDVVVFLVDIHFDVIVFCFSKYFFFVDMSLLFPVLVFVVVFFVFDVVAVVSVVFVVLVFVFLFCFCCCYQNLCSQ